MSEAYPDPSTIGRKVIDPVGNGLAQVCVNEVLLAHLFWLPLGLVFAPAIGEVPDQFLLLRIDGDDRLPPTLKRLDLLIDVLKLRIAIGVGCPLLRLARALQTVTQPLQQLRNLGVTDSMTLAVTLIGQHPSTHS